MVPSKSSKSGLGVLGLMNRGTSDRRATASTGPKVAIGEEVFEKPSDRETWARTLLMLMDSGCESVDSLCPSASRA